MTGRVSRLAEAVRNLGVPHFISYALRRLRNQFGTPAVPFSLGSRLARAPLWCRPGASDLLVFEQVFRQREYRCIDSVADVALIIDCGANVGFSAAYFLSRYPDAKLVAVEPDPDNFAALVRNLAPYGNRVRSICSGLWSHSCGLVMNAENFGDGREWAQTVRPARADEKPAMMATDVGTLLHESGFARISILKIDIEGSEATVFSVGDLQWLDAVDNLVIELHGQRCTEIFFDAIRNRGFAVTRCDELTVCKRVQRSSPAETQLALAVA